MLKNMDLKEDKILEANNAHRIWDLTEAAMKVLAPCSQVEEQRFGSIGPWSQQVRPKHR
jgi:hypothetical protein